MKVGQRERNTQERVVKFFQDHLKYEYLGNWASRNDSRNIETEALEKWLLGKGYSSTHITKTLRELSQAAALGGGKNLFDANKAVYSLLRYGVKVKEGAGELSQTVWLIDWQNPENNHFAIAEEVTVKGENKKRPDIVIYVNGIALGILELKRSTVSVSEGIRQNLDNQKKEFIRPFFSTMQLVMAGNDSEGIRYATIGTPEKHYLTWKEHNNSGLESLLDFHLDCLCNKQRFLEIVHDFIIFDYGMKKVPRHNQYFGVKAAQDRIQKREGGIIWHTQGSGKSITMVWLAKWIRETQPDARVLILTDRTDLDEQIEGIFFGVGEQITRIRNATVKGKKYLNGGEALVATLQSNEDWLMAALVHKFGSSQKSTNDFIPDMERLNREGLRIPGNLFVFVDECHRTQSGKLHEAMKLLLPDAMFIGFTGTPLLKENKRMSIKVFGSYIHTYKYKEAISDGVVLELRYEARDIDQVTTSQDRIDQWFGLKTRGLSDMAKEQLKQKWGTLRKVLSSKSRLEVIVNDILVDMETRPRLMDGRGNAILVCASIYEACSIYEMFSKTDLAGKVAIVSSYKPSVNDIKREETGSGPTVALKKYEIYRKMLADFFELPPGQALNKIDEFEKQVKERFKKEPGQMKLLIVVDKLLTGFDAPPATYLYIDKQMRDHGLFQAVCRVNRLDGEDKEYGYIIDYKNLFNNLEGAIIDYTSGALDGFEVEDVRDLLTDRLDLARFNLEAARESIKALCEPVRLPRSTSDYMRYFCAADASDKYSLKENEPKRVTLYKLTNKLLRAYANIANEALDAGYTEKQFKVIQEEVVHYENVSKEMKIASGDVIDMKLYEPYMRHLIDTYIRAEDSRKISDFEDLSLVSLIVDKGPEEATKRAPKNIRKDKKTMAEAIENNLRRLIAGEKPANPEYYEKMSELLEEIVKERRSNAQSYEAYLKKIKDLATKVKKPHGSDHYPESMDTSPLRALYDNLKHNETLAVRIDDTIRRTKQDGWRGNRFKERALLNAIRDEMDGYSEDEVLEIFELVKAQSDY